MSAELGYVRPTSPPVEIGRGAPSATALDLGQNADPPSDARRRGRMPWWLLLLARLKIWLARSDRPAAVISVFFHGLLLLILAAWTRSVPVGHAIAHAVIEVDTAVDAPPGLFETGDWANEESPALRDAAGDPLRTGADESLEGKEEGLAGAEGALSAATEAMGSGLAGATEAAGGASSRGLGAAKGIGGSDGGAAGAGAAFFGVSAPGRRFVYVIDRSYSMAENNALLAAKNELLQSLERLQPGMEFQVIFYNDDPRPLRERKTGVIPVSLQSIRRAKDEISQFNPAGSTNHEKALRKALELHPDAVFMLTDAEDADEKLITLITQLNQKQRNKHRPASINVIQFHHGADRSPDRAIKKLADKNQGHYRVVETASVAKRP